MSQPSLLWFPSSSLSSPLFYFLFFFSPGIVTAPQHALTGIQVVVVIMLSSFPIGRVPNLQCNKRASINSWWLEPERTNSPSHMVETLETSLGKSAWVFVKDCEFNEVQGEYHHYDYSQRITNNGCYDIIGNAIHNFSGLQVISRFFELVYWLHISRS